VQTGVKEEDKRIKDAKRKTKTGYRPIYKNKQERGQYGRWAKRRHGEKVEVSVPELKTTKRRSSHF